nr:reverse transcriptase domain-containing protein [Tanacetum cinerariifolium]
MLMALIDIRVDRELKDEMIIAIPNVEDDEDVLYTVRVKHTSRGTNTGSKFQYKHKKQVYQAVSKKNSASLSGTKKNSELPRHETNSANPLDALNMTENDDELGSNEGSSNSCKKAIHEVVGSTSSSPSTTPLVAKINQLESQVLDGKPVLVGDDGKPLKPCKSTIPSSSNVASK